MGSPSDLLSRHFSPASTSNTLCPGKGCSPLLCCASGVLLSAGPVSHSFTHSSTQRYALCFYYVPGAVLDTGVELRTEFLPWL